MSYTTNQKIRVEAGFQNRFNRVPFQSNPNGIATEFFLTNDDYVKIVPEFGVSSATTGVSHVAVYVGLSGVAGVSRMNVSNIDADIGSITLDTAPDNGSSLTVTYASSAIPENEVTEVLNRAESTINKRLSLCYDLPISEDVPELTRLSTQLAAALLLIRSYGTANPSTAQDGYAMYDRLIGENYGVINTGDNAEVEDVGEIGLICRAGYELVNKSGEELTKNATGALNNSKYTAGGRVDGRIYDITEEPFRFKDYQTSTDNREQPGSNLPNSIYD